MMTVPRDLGLVRTDNAALSARNSARATLLLAALGLAGCGGAQAPRSRSGATVGTTAPRASGAPLEEGKASYYSDKLAGRSTANGEPYDPRALTAAHRTLPFGARVDVARPDGRHVT